jgi:hypothetical protein
VKRPRACVAAGLGGGRRGGVGGVFKGVRGWCPEPDLGGAVCEQGLAGVDCNGVSWALELSGISLKPNCATPHFHLRPQIEHRLHTQITQNRVHGARVGVRRRARAEQQARAHDARAPVARDAANVACRREDGRSSGCGWPEGLFLLSAGLGFERRLLSRPGLPEVGRAVRLDSRKFATPRRTLGPTACVAARQVATRDSMYRPSRDCIHSNE